MCYSWLYDGHHHKHMFAANEAVPGGDNLPVVVDTIAQKQTSVVSTYALLKKNHDLHQ